MSVLMFDPSGNRIPLGRRTIQLPQPFAIGTTPPSWLTALNGTLTALDTTTTRGIIRTTSAATTNSRATLQGPAFDWDNIMAMILLCESFKVGQTTAINIEMGIGSPIGTANPIGARLQQLSAAARPTATSLKGSTALENHTPNPINLSTLKDTGPRTLGLAVFPRHNEWAVLGDGFDTHFVSPKVSTWGWASQSGQVVPYIDVQTTENVAKHVDVSSFRVIVDTW